MNVFDIIGPVMIGPSSSHTAGAVRLGLVARQLLGGEPVEASIGLCGSFARTYKGHGTDRALVAGILGLRQDDERLRGSLELAAQRGLKLSLREVELEDAHPNTAVIELTDAKGKSVRLEGASIGGGNVRISRVNGLPAIFTGERPTLLVLHRDEPGVIAAVADRLSRQGANICSFQLARLQRGGLAVMTIEMDAGVPERMDEGLSTLPQVLSCTYLAPI